MKLSVSLFRAVLWSLLFSILIRIIFGLHAVFETPVLIIPLLLGIFAAIGFTPPSTAGFALISVLHMILVTVFTVILDYTGLMRELAYDSAVYFAGSADGDIARISLFWSILFVTSVYFAVYVIFGGIICRFRSVRYSRINNSEIEYDEFDNSKSSTYANK